MFADVPGLQRSMATAANSVHGPKHAETKRREEDYFDQHLLHGNGEVSRGAQKGHEGQASHQVCSTTGASQTPSVH